MTLPDENDHYQAQEGLGSLRTLRRTFQGNIENSLQSGVKTPRRISRLSGVQPHHRDKLIHSMDLSLR